MRHYLAITALLTSPVYSQVEPDITLFDDRIVVEVSEETASGFDENQYWTMLNEQGWEATKKAVQGQPISPELSGELTYQETLKQLDTLVAKRKTAGATDLIDEHPEWQSCDRIQWLWLDLKNEVSTGYGKNARAKFQNILDNCSGHELSTTQKLLSWTSGQAKSDVLSRYQSSPNYDAKSGAKIQRDLNAEKQTFVRIDENNLDQSERRVAGKQDAKLAELLGWRYLESGQPEKALEWFENAIGWGGATSKRVEGKLLSLQGLGEQKRLHVEQQIWAKEFSEIAKLDFGEGAEIDLACESSPETCLEALRDKEALSPQELALKGWKLYELQRPISAALAFEQSLATLPPTDEDWDLTQYGYMLSLEHAGYTDKAEMIATQINDTEKRGKIDRQIALKQVYYAFEQKEYDETLFRISQYEAIFGKEVELIEMKAWALYNSRRKKEALDEYTVLAESFPHDEKIQRSYQILKCGFAVNSSVCQGLGY